MADTIQLGKLHGRFVVSDGPAVHPLPDIPYRVSRQANLCINVLRSLICPPPAYWCERPELFARIADGKDAEERTLAVLRWFIVMPML